MTDIQTTPTTAADPTVAAGTAQFLTPVALGFQALAVNGKEAQPRDGVAITGETEIVVEALDDAEVVMVDAR